MANAISGAIVVANHGMPFLRLDSGERSGPADQWSKDDFFENMWSIWSRLEILLSLTILSEFDSKFLD